MPKVRNHGQKSQITDSAIDRIIKLYVEESIRETLIDADCQGLNIRPTKNGKAEWSIKMSDQSGVQRRFSLGQYPTIKLKKAREAAEITRYKVRHQGLDPTAERESKREAARNPPPPSLTFQGMIDLYAQQFAPIRKCWQVPKPEEKGKKSVLGDGKRRIESVFHAHLSTAAKDLKRSELLKTIYDWPSKSSAAAAVRYLKPVMIWGADLDYVPAELALLKQPAGAIKEGSRYLKEDELGRVLVVLRDMKIAKKLPPFAAAMQLILITATRSAETSLATWGEFNLDEGMWVIPGERIKNTKPDGKDRPPFVIPLPRQAIELLKSLKPASLSPTDFVFTNRNGVPVSQWDRFTKLVQAKSGVFNWHRHDLRRTAATSMGVLGVPTDIVDAALNHAVIHSKLAGTYNKNRYTKEVGMAMQKLADWYDCIEQNARMQMYDIVPPGEVGNSLKTIKRSARRQFGRNYKVAAS